MKTLKVPVCLVAGHEWRVSRSVPDHQTCIRCGVRLKIRNPLGSAAATRTEEPWQDIAAPTEVALGKRPEFQAELESESEVEAEEMRPIGLHDGALAANSEVPAERSAMLTIAIVSRKGGGGKSTLAVHLAIGAHLRGFRTMVADADPQRSVCEVLKLRNGSGPTCAEASLAEVSALQDLARRSGEEVLVVDTPAGAIEEIGAVIALADLTLIAVRPTYLDIAAAVSTIETVRRLGGNAQIVLTQAPSRRGGQEMPSVLKAIEALRFTRLPLCPVVIHSRTAFQTAVAAGRSAEEFGRSVAADEVNALWKHVAGELLSAMSARSGAAVAGGSSLQFTSAE